MQTVVMSCHGQQGGIPLTRPLASAVVQPSVQYVTDMTAAMSDTSARELKFGNCTDMWQFSAKVTPILKPAQDKPERSAAVCC